MTTYLTIITTALVITQVVRLIQNTINLKLQKKEVYKHLADLDKMQPTVEDFERQKAVMEMLYWKLKKEEDEDAIN